MKVVLPNGVTDTRPNGDEENIEVIAPQTNVHTDITVTIVTDAYGSETTWSICDDNFCYMAGGPYKRFNISRNNTTNNSNRNNTHQIIV